MSLPAMAVFMAKLAVASIPAALILLLILVPAKAVIQQQVARQADKTIKEVAVALKPTYLPWKNSETPPAWNWLNTKADTATSKPTESASVEPEPARVPVTFPDSKPAYRRYWRALEACADTVRRIEGLYPTSTVDQRDSVPEIGKRNATIHGVLRQSNRQVEFVCEVSSAADGVRISRVRTNQL